MNIMLALIVGIVIGYMIKGCETEDKYKSESIKVTPANFKPPENPIPRINKTEKVK